MTASGANGANGVLRVVGIGGGTGLSVLLAGLRDLEEATNGTNGGATRPRLEVTAVVSVADDGGSTGRLRRDLGIPAVGDLRNCLVAMSGGSPLWRDLFQYRFVDGNGLGGHAVGNLVMAGLAQQAGGLLPALERLARPLRLRGRVLPVTEEAVTLCARRADGEVVEGESRIAGRAGAIADVWLFPERPQPARGVLEAIVAADVVVLGPGSLFTSVVPNLLVGGVAEALRSTRALRIFVCNLMTQPGETEGFDAADHLRVIERRIGRAVDVCLVSRGGIPGAARDGASGCRPVNWSHRSLAAAGVLPIVADVLPDGELGNRHDARKLARSIVSMARVFRRNVPATVAAVVAPVVPSLAPTEPSPAVH